MTATGPGTIVKSRYEPVSGDAVKHIHNAVFYMQNRETGGPEEPGPRALFTGTATHISSKEARTLLRGRHDKRVLFHREIMSPSTSFGLRGEDDMRAWTQEVVATLEDHLGLDLAWCGAVHRNTAHAHAHVLIRGAGISRADGKQVRVTLRRRELDVLRQAGVAAGLRLATTQRDDRTATLRSELDAMVYCPPIPVTPTPTVTAIERKEEPRESLTRRLFGRGR